MVSNTFLQRTLFHKPYSTITESDNIPVCFHGLHFSEEALSLLPGEQQRHRSVDQSKYLLWVSVGPACLLALEAQEKDKTTKKVSLCKDVQPTRKLPLD